MPDSPRIAPGGSTVLRHGGFALPLFD